MSYIPSNAHARRSMVALGKLIVPSYDERLHWYHHALAEALEGLLRYTRFRGRLGGYARVAISMPPRHGKSLHGTELLPALAHGVDPSLKIIVATHTAELAKRGVTNTQGWLQEDKYKATFKTRVGRVESFDDKTGELLGIVESKNAAHRYSTLRPKYLGSTEYVDAGGYYMAQGMGGSLTGEGFELGILDDLIKNAEEAMSSKHLARLWGFYTSTFDTRANHEFAGQLYIGTRWTTPDFVDELVDYWRSEAGDRDVPIKVLRFPAIAEEPLEDGDPREPGEGLNKSSYMSVSFYEGKRRALMTQQPWVWHGLWQQRPQAMGTKFFQPDDWMTFDANFKLDMLHCIDFSVDAALTESGASWTVITVTGVLIAPHNLGEDAGEHYFMLDEGRGHWGIDDMRKELKRLWDKWHAAQPSKTNMGSIWVEDKALGPQLVSYFEGQLPIVPVPKGRNASKLTCYRVASQVTSLKRVRIPVGTWGRDPTNPMLPLITDEWVGSKDVKGSWVQEQMSFPSTPDDRRDSLAQQIIKRTSWIDDSILK